MKATPAGSSAKLPHLPGGVAGLDKVFSTVGGEARPHAAAMVARVVTADGTRVATLHRTFLRPDGLATAPRSATWLGRDHLRQQPRPDRDHPQRRPHRRRRSLDRRAHRTRRGALRRPGAGEPGHRRRPLRTRVRLRSPPASPFTFAIHVSTCRSPGSRSRGRTACRRPSTGRRPGTSRSAACATLPSSTTWRNTEGALRAGS